MIEVTEFEARVKRTSQGNVVIVSRNGVDMAIVGGADNALKVLDFDVNHIDAQSMQNLKCHLAGKLDAENVSALFNNPLINKSV